jgi:hypothetical protein
MLVAPMTLPVGGGFPTPGSTTFASCLRRQLGDIVSEAFVPNLWGLWNMLHLRIRDRCRIPQPLSAR